MKIENNMNTTNYNNVHKPVNENTSETTQKKIPPEKAFDTVQKSRKDMFMLHNKNNVNVETEYKNLTTEQIDYLKNKYDVSNLSSKEHESLMTELCDMGAISTEDKWATYKFKPLYSSEKFDGTKSIRLNMSEQPVETDTNEQELDGTYSLLELIRQKINGEKPVNHSIDSEKFKILDSLKHTYSILQLLVRK